MQIIAFFYADEENFKDLGRLLVKVDAEFKNFYFLDF